MPDDALDATILGIYAYLLEALVPTYPHPQLQPLVQRHVQLLQQYRPLQNSHPQLSALLDRLMAHHQAQLDRLLSADGVTPPALADLTPHEESSPAGDPDVATPATDPGPAIDASPLASPMAFPQVAANVSLSPTVNALTIALPAPLPFEPGQYVKLELTDGGQTLSRSYSIAHATTTPPSLTFWIKRVLDGSLSPRLHQVQPGQSIGVSPARGNLTLERLPAAVTQVLFIASGTGLAPLHALIDPLLTQHPEVTLHLLWGVRTLDEAFMLEAYRHLATVNPRFQPHICISDEPITPQDLLTPGLVTAPLDGLPADLFPRAHCFLVGNGQMIRAATQLLRAKGVPGSSIHTEAFF